MVVSPNADREFWLLIRRLLLEVVGRIEARYQLPKRT
jgi:hypothetical protein